MWFKISFSATLENVILIGYVLVIQRLSFDTNVIRFTLVAG